MASTASEPLALYNGQLRPRSEVHIEFHDAGFVYGVTVTDACRTVGGRLFRWPDHLARFRHDCQLCHIPLPYSDVELTGWADELIRRNDPGREQVLITCATPGPLHRYLGEGPLEDAEPTLLMHTFPLDTSRYEPLLRRGARLRTVSGQPGGLIDPTVKHRSRLHWWLAERQCQPGEVPLLLDSQGTATDTPLAAFLIVRGGCVLTPPRRQILSSISLKVTSELCSSMGIPVEECSLSIAECLECDEAMLTGTNFGLGGVSAIDGVSLPWPGPVTQLLMERWARLLVGS